MSHFYDLDFEQIKENIKAFLDEDETFSGYNFTGSAVSAVLDIAALVEQNGAFYLNNVANEFFITTAKQARNIYKNAKQLNYYPTRKTAAYIEVNFSSLIDLTIPQFTTFNMSGVDLVLFENVTLDDSNSRTQNVILYEGEVITETGIVDTENLFSFTFSTAYVDICNDHFFVYVDVLDESTDTYPESTNLWTSADLEIFETNTNSYYTAFTDTELTIQFDNGTLFNIPSIDDQIRVIYLKTLGSGANGSTGTIESDIPELVIDEGSNSLINGTDEESVEEIKIRAPLFHSSQNRAVTAKDWNAIMKKYSRYDTFKSGLAWGGEDENVTDEDSEEIVEGDLGYVGRGKVVITALKSDFEFLIDDEIDLLLEFLEKFKIVGLRLWFLHSNVYEITPTVSIKTNPSLTFSQTEFEDTINEYLNDLEYHSSEFYKSKLTQKIDEQNSIIYSDVSFTTGVKVKNEDYKVIRINSEIVPGSVTGTIDALALTDSANQLYYDGSPVGEINYTTGFMKFTETIGTGDDFEFTFELASDLTATAADETVFNFNDITVVNL